MANISPERFVALRERSNLTQQEMGNILGITAKYVGMIERGAKGVEELSSLGLLFRMHENSAGEGGQVVLDRHQTASAPGDRGSDTARLIPVIGWAHAGEAASYDEIPKDWQCRIPTDCPDEHAFAVVLEGDSMEPKFSEGDWIIVQPGLQPYSGCFVVARFADDGVIFRRMEMSGGMIRLMPLNDRWQPSEHKPDEFSWLYPVWGRFTQIWRRR